MHVVLAEIQTTDLLFFVDADAHGSFEHGPKMAKLVRKEKAPTDEGTDELS